jgi:hypothetical protein
VVVRFDRQTDAATLAAAAQDFTTVSSGHTGAETMHAHTTPNFGLVSTFCSHAKTSQSKKNKNCNKNARKAQTAQHYTVNSTKWEVKIKRFDLS